MFALLYRLPGLMSDERLIEVKRKHFFVFFKKIILSAVLAILPFVFLYLFLQNNFFLLENQVYFPILLLAASAYYLFVLLFTLFSFIDYYLNIFAVTNKRIIAIKQDGFFSRVISELDLDRVEDITSEVKGAFPTIFKYGTINIQTAGEMERFLFREVAGPNELRDSIIKLAEENKKK